MDLERIIIVKGKTRLESLIERFNSRAQTKFYIEHNGGDFDQYKKEHDTFYAGLNIVQKRSSSSLKTMVVERDYLSTFLFDSTDLIVVVGQDGLVANAAKYVGRNPILAVNPDPDRNTGILLPFGPENFEKGLSSCLQSKAHFKEITMANALMNDGQELLAFNDFFIGKSDHTSARYTLSFEGEVENQSSSGMIISTGAGSTGWLSSVFNEFNGLFRLFGKNAPGVGLDMDWSDDRLCFVVREPYKSPFTSANIVAGLISQNQSLTIESTMPENGVVFSDGITKDFLTFNAGSRITITTAKEKAKLIIN